MRCSTSPSGMPTATTSQIPVRSPRAAIASCSPASSSLERVGYRFVEAQRGPVADGGLPAAFPEPRARGLEVGGAEPLLDGARGLAVAMRGRRPGQSPGAFQVVVDGGDRRQAEESLAGDGCDDELAAEPQLGAERLTS